MPEKEVKLSVNNLKISFRTPNGKVQAVRGIDFDLYKGETLAVVGESGSGKSVTTRAILGILANNAIKEGGEIIYDGEDLMKILEEGFHAIRGDKIAMIFQDPLSSLNPIMRVGKQMTEAMLIKGKVNQKQARKNFNAMLARLNKYMDIALDAENHAEIKAENKRKCRDFDKFEYKHLELETAYNKAREAADEFLSEVDYLLFRMEKEALTDIEGSISDLLRRAMLSVHPYLVRDRAEELKGLVSSVREQLDNAFTAGCKRLAATLFKRSGKEKKDYAKISESLRSIKEILEEAVGFTMPNFFSMGYYLTFSKEPLPELSVEELNKFLRKYLDEHFMLDFISVAAEGLKASRTRSTKSKKETVGLIDELLPLFSEETLDRKKAEHAAGRLISAVEGSIDRLEIKKDNVEYTFGSCLKAALDVYFNGIARNAAEEKRYARQKAAYDKNAAKGKTPEWKLAEKNLVDLSAAQRDIVRILNRLKEDYVKKTERENLVDFGEKTVEVIDYLKEQASNVVHKVTKRMARNRALKLLEEVGIPEPRKRYRQYPFEFSGGMRQRIVIAIALSANPDILVCDEPTTALDVTIQSQILELINKVKREHELSVIFITHDLGVVANMADRVAVMYAGKIVEIGTAEDVFYSPAHPYTWALLSSMPDLDTRDKLEAIPGTPPNMIYPPKGDAFAERNKYAMRIDFEEQPPMFKISETHSAATWLLHPDAPKVEIPKAVTDRIARLKQSGGNE